MTSILDILENPAPTAAQDWWNAVGTGQPPAPDRGVVADTVVNMARGGFGVLELLARAAAGADELVDRHVSPEPVGGGGFDLKRVMDSAAVGIGEWKDEVFPQSRQTAGAGPRGWIGQGVESATTSLGVRGPAALAGAAAGSVFGPAGTVAGGVLGWLSGVPAFGLAQYQEALGRYRAKGIDEGEAQTAAMLEGGSEMAFEAASDLITAASLGIGGMTKAVSYPAKEALKKTAFKLIQRPVATAAKKAAVITGAETLTELMNAGTQTEIQRIHGLHDQRFWDGLTENLGPIVVAGMIFGALGGGVSLLQQRQVKKLLTQPDPEGADAKKLAEHRQQRQWAASQVADALAKVAPSAAIEFRKGAQVAIDNGAAIPGEIDLEGPRRREAEKAVVAETPVADAGGAHLVDKPPPKATTLEPTPITEPAPEAVEDRPAGGQAKAQQPAQDLRSLMNRPTSGEIGPPPDPIQVNRELMRGELRKSDWERARDVREAQRLKEAELEARLPEIATEAARRLAEAQRWGITLPEYETKRLNALIERHQAAQKKAASEQKAAVNAGIADILSGPVGKREMSARVITPTPVDWGVEAARAGIAESASEPAATVPVEEEAPPTPVDWDMVAQQAGIAETPLPAPEVDPQWAAMARAAGLTEDDVPTPPPALPGDGFSVQSAAPGGGVVEAPPTEKGSEAPAIDSGGSAVAESVAAENGVEYKGELYGVHMFQDPLSGGVSVDNLEDLPRILGKKRAAFARKAAGDRREAPRGDERRKDAALRKRVAEMTPEEMQRELLTDYLTGLGNKRAYAESEKRAVQTSIDVDSLKWVNDNLGHDAGDALLKAIGQALTGQDAYHVSGDEFVLQADAADDVDSAMVRAYDYLEANPITIDQPDGSTVTVIGSFSYGKGQTLSDAERGLQENKRQREVDGKRSARGEKPPGVLRIGPVGDQDIDRGQGGPREAVAPEAQPEVPRQPIPPPEAVQAPAVVTPPAPKPAPAQDIVTKAGKPFKNAQAAKFVQRQQKLEDSHSVVHVPGGFALRAKAPAKPEASSVHDYSSTQVRLPEPAAKRVRDFAAAIPDAEIYTEADDDSYGREDEPHITVRYGLETDNPDDIAPAFEGIGEITTRLGKVSIFEADKYDVVKIDVESEDLEGANRSVGQTVALPGETHTDYKPHVTIAFVKKGEGKKYVGDDTFDGTELNFGQVELSARDGKLHAIPLAGRKASQRKAADIQGMTEAEIDAALDDVLGPEDTASTTTNEAIGKLRADLDRKGAGALADPLKAYERIGFKILQLDNGTFYFEHVRKGVRQEKGPGYPARWSRATAIDEAIKEAESIMRERPAAARPKAPAEMTFAEFEKEYRRAFGESNKYGIDQVGSGYWMDRMAELSDAHPDWAARIEEAKEPKAAAETVEFEVKSMATGKTSTLRVPKNPGAKKTAGQLAGKATTEIGAAVKHTLAGLDALFGGPNRLSSGMTFDEDTYAKARPHFEAALKSAVDAGHTLADLIRYLAGRYGAAIRPYLKRFLNDQAAINVDKNDSENDTLAGPSKDGGVNEIRGENQGGDRGRPGPQEAPDSERGDGGLYQRTGDVPEKGDGEHHPAGGATEAGRGDSERGASDTRPVDYRITAADNLGEGGVKQKFKDNLAAIRVLKKLAGDGVATAEDQAILVKYVGWGGLSQAFVRPDGSVAKGWEKEAAELKALFTDDEYAAARRSTQDAHYTSRKVVEAIYAGIERIGFAGGRILEPSAGTGNFIGLSPEGIRSASRFTAIELDPTTAAIARHLYPNQKIVNSGFEKVTLAENSYDLAIGNPPFGDKTLFDPDNKDLRHFSIHNYFFAKSLRALRADGLLAMVVSSHLMDKQSATEREWFAQNAELLGAVRLPSTAFAENAGTEVTTDILFLRKRREGEQPKKTEAKWAGLEAVKGDDGIIYRVNAYFAKNPYHMLGRLGHNKLQKRSADEIIVDGVYTAVPGLLPNEGGVPLQVMLAKALMDLPQGVYSSGKTFEEVQAPDIVVTDPGFTMPYGFGLSDSGEAVRRLGDVNGETRWEPVLYSGSPLEGKRLGRFKAMLVVRDAVRRLMRAELADDSRMDRLRGDLNRVYDRFVSEYGYFNDYANNLLFGPDPTDYPLLRSLERDYDKGVSKATAKRNKEVARPASAKKASIFTKRLREPYREAARADTPADALAIVLRERGRIDIPRICTLCGKDTAAVTDALGTAGLIFQDPDGGQWLSKEQYLSGNVKKKLAAAKAAGLRANIEALEKVQPPDASPAQIRVNVGASWVPARIYEQFAADQLGATMSVAHHEAIGRWQVVTTGTSGASPLDAQSMPAHEIYARTVSGREITVYSRDADGNPVLDRDATDEARAKAVEIERLFGRWVLEDSDRADSVARAFNDKVNTHHETEWDGSHMIFPGMGTINPSVARDDQLNPHQKNAVWRLIQKGGGLLDHVVGAGKTFAAIAAGLEMRRMGLVKKPLYVVPNRLVEQWSADFQTLYPGANILVIGRNDFTAKRRQEFLGRIATGDWDAVLLAHSSFGFIRSPIEYERRFLRQQVDDFETAIEEMKAAEGKKARTVKEAERARDKLIERLNALNDSARDRVVDFADLGVDALFVDEAHEFKNLFYVTSRNRVAGLGDKKGSQKAFKLFLKTRYLQETQAGKGVFFLTGTPVSNTIAEMYTMMRYQAYDQLVAAGIRHFDQWAGGFAAVTSDWEVDPSGTRYRLQSRFREFINIPGMMGIYKDFADVVTQAGLVETAEKAGKVWPVPKIKGGKPENVVVERSEDQASYMRWVVHRMDNMPRDPREDNPLKATGDAMKASLDMRLIDPTLPDHPGSKVNVAVQRMLDIYRKWAERRGTQLVFCDLSVPKKAAGRHAAEIQGLRARIAELAAALESETDADRIAEIEEQYEAAAKKFERFSPAEIMAAEQGAFSVYDDIKAKLIAAGVPEKEVAFIHDVNTDKQTEDLFERVRRGEVRILLGSTSKMGAGMNVQDRLVALHHLDAPWRPSDLEQREGRIVRRGNRFFDESVAAGGPRFEVEVMRYSTKESLDTRRWQIIEDKARVVEQLRAGGIQWGESIEDAGGEAANAAEMKAAASGNPLILEEIQLRKQIADLETSWRNFENDRHSAIAAERRAKAAERDMQKDIKAIRSAVATAEEDAGSDPARWQIVIDGTRIAPEGLVSVPAEMTEAQLSVIADDARRKAAVSTRAKAIKAAEAHNKKALVDAKKRYADAVSALVTDVVDKTDFGREISYRGVSYVLRPIRGWTVVQFEMNTGAEGFLQFESSFLVDSKELSPDGLLVRLKNRIDKLMLAERDSVLRVEAGAKSLRAQADRLAPLREKKFENQDSLDAARARHGEVLAAVRGEAANAPAPQEDIDRWTRGRRPARQPDSGSAEARPTAADQSHEYFIYTTEGYKTPDELGYKSVSKIELDVDGFEFFVYQRNEANSYGQKWIVVEASTGFSITGDKTRRGAIQSANNLIAGQGLQKLRDGVAEQIQAGNKSPWAGGPRPDYRRRRNAAERAATVADVRAVFPGQTVGSSPDGGVWVKLRGGAMLVIRKVRRIGAGAGVSMRVGKAGDGDILGQYLEREILLQEDLGGRETLRHETVHFLERAGVMLPAEIAALKRHIKALHANGKWQTEETEIGGIEDRAEWIAKNITRRENMHGPLRKMLSRVADYLASLWNLAVRTLGADSLTSARGVAADVASGEMFGRQALERDSVATPDPRALYRRRRQAEAEIEADTLGFMETLKAALRPAQLTKEKTKDLGYIQDLILRTPAFFAEKLHGTKQIYRAAQNRQSEFHNLLHNLENHGDVNAVKLWDTLPEAERQRAARYVVETDQEPGGYRVSLSGDGRHWVVKDDAGKIVDHFKSAVGDDYVDAGEMQAVKRRRELEAEALAADGFSPGQVAVIMAFRTSTDKGFDILARDMRRAAAIAERTGAKPPVITIVEDGKPARISMTEAMARMGDLRGSYFPRIRPRGRFVLRATREGQTGRLETFALGPAMNVRAAALRKQGWTVETTESDQLGEDVFEMAGRLSATQQMVNAALERADRQLRGDKRLGDDEMAELRASVEEIFASALSEQIAAVIRQRGSRAHMTRRAGELWLGYEENPQIALSKYIRGLAGGESKRRMTVRMMKALTGTEISREDFDAATRFNGDYDAFMTETALEAPEAMTPEMFAAINDPAAAEENETAIADAEAMLARATDEDERKALSASIAEKKRWGAARYRAHVTGAMLDQRRQPNAYKWAKAFIGENTRNPEAADRAIGVFRGLAVAKYLAFRVFAAPVVNLTALPTTAIATMKAAGISYGDTWRLLSSGIIDYGKYRTGRLTGDPGRQRVFDYIREQGWDNAQFNSEAMSTLRSVAGRAWDRVLEYGMLTFSESERLNRGATISAAYAGLKKLHPEESFEALMARALKVSDDAHGVYNRGNYPYMALGRHPAAHVARMFNVFKVFAHTYFQNMARIGFEQKDYKALAHMVLAPAVLAGAGASVATTLVSAALSAFGVDEPEEEMYAAIGGMFGETAEEVARHGAIGQVGFTVKGSLAVSVGDLPTNLRDLLGAPLSVVMDFYDAIGLAFRGDWIKALEKASPTGLGNIAKAVRERTDGVTTKTNRPVFFGDEQLRPTVVESFWRGFGFSPTRIAMVREQQRSEYLVARRYDARRADIYAKIRKYAADGETDPAALAEIMGEVAAFNEGASRWRLALITRKRLWAAANTAPTRYERTRGEAPIASLLAAPGSDAERMIAELMRRGYLDISEPSRSVVYRHRRYEMPDDAYAAYRSRSSEIARRKIERSAQRLLARSPERQAEEIQKIVSASRRAARQAARRAALASGPVTMTV